MKDIIRGYQRFRDTVFPTKRELFEQLGDGQHPRALFICCSDSRVDPEKMTSMDPGQLFIIRNAGNIIPAHNADAGSVSASVEYAMKALEVPYIIVCGHSGCGAMKAVLHPDTLDALPEVASWIEHASGARAILEAEGIEHHGSDEELLRRCVELNVLVQIDNLVTHPAVAARAAVNQVQIYGWYYDIPSGSVFAYDPEAQHFEPLDEKALEDVIPVKRLVDPHHP